MAKIVLIIEDGPDGGVKITSNPSFEEMAKLLGDRRMTSAHGYAICALRSVAEASNEMKRDGGRQIIKLPKPRIIGS